MSNAYGKMEFARIEDRMLVDGYSEPPKGNAADDMVFTDENPLRDYTGPLARITVSVELFDDAASPANLGVRSQFSQIASTPIDNGAHIQAAERAFRAALDAAMRRITRGESK